MSRLIPIFFLLLIVGCATGSAFDDRIGVASEEGGALLEQATRAALRTINERKTATLVYATLQREQTRDNENRAATEFARALTQTPLAATAQAYTDARTATAALRTRDAVDALQTQAAHASQSRTAQANERATADASATRVANETATAQANARATAIAFQTDAPLTALAKEYAAQQMQIQIAQAQVDAENAKTRSEFIESIIKIILGVGAFALLVMLIIFLARYLDAQAMRQRFIETRAGTLFIVHVNGQPHAQIIKETPNLLEAPARDELPDFDAPTQAPAITAHADETFVKVTSARGTDFIARDDPEQAQRETERQLMLRFLRESIQYVRAQKQSPLEANRVPTCGELGWSSETWVRAVKLLKPHVVTRQGRGGGTFCSAEYPNLMALYVAVGERRIPNRARAREETGEVESPSPLAHAVAA